MHDLLTAIYHDLMLDSPVVRWAIALPILHALAMWLGWLPAGEWTLREWFYLPRP